MLPLTPRVNHPEADDGLICGYLFDEAGSALALSSAKEALPHLSEAQSGHGGFVWLHFNLTHANTLRWLRDNAALSHEFFEALEGGSRSARIERDHGGLFSVINDITYDFSFDAEDVGTLWMSVTEHWVISVRKKPLKSVDRLRTAVNRGARMATPVQLLDHLLEDQADELQVILRRASERLDDVEDLVLTGRPHRFGAELSDLRRLMVRLQRLLTPEPSALSRILGRAPAWMTSEDLQHLTRAHEEFNLVLRDIAAMQDRIKLIQDETATRVAEENNRSLFTLTMVTVMVLPINLISGLFGMNVGGIPFANHDAGFWIMLTLVATLTGCVALVLIRRRSST
jgi:zinc transporter